MLSVFFYYESSHLLNFPNEHEILIMQNVDEMGHVSIISFKKYITNYEIVVKLV
jgi:hypothetical protein